MCTRESQTKETEHEKSHADNKRNTEKTSRGIDEEREKEDET